MKKIIVMFALLFCGLSMFSMVGAEIDTPARIAEVFPDTMLAQEIASILGKETDEYVTQTDLNTIRELTISSGGTNWTGVQHLTHLRYFSFHNAKEGFVGNLRDLTSFADLHTIYLSNIDSIQGSVEELSTLKELTNLNLSNVGIECTITNLSSFDKLRSVVIHDANIKGNLAVFAEAKNLIDLEIVGTNLVGDISSLSKKENLRYVYFSDTPGITGNLSSLTDLTDIYYLYLRRTGIAGNIACLSNLENIRFLTLIGEFSGEANVITSLPKLEDVHFSSSDITCTLNNSFLELKNLREFSSSYVDYVGDIGILGKLSCSSLDIRYTNYQLPEIEFREDKSIEIDVPQISQDRALTPQENTLVQGEYSEGKIQWAVPQGNVSSMGGQYSYYTNQSFTQYDPYKHFVFDGTIIQPYKKPRTTVEGDIGTASYASITGLSIGKKYAISSDAFEGGITVKYRIEADGTVGTQIVDTDKYEAMPVLAQNSIINLENYKAYTVYELSEADFIPTPTPTPDSSLEGDIVGGESAFNKLPPVKVPTLVLPDGTIEKLDLTLKFNEPIKEGKNNIKYDVRLVDSKGNKVELPEECILCFPYPEGLDETSGNRYRIMIHHLGDKGMEKFSTEDGTIDLKPQGLCIRVSSLSPFIIEWEELPEADLPQTGDSSHIALWLALLTVAGAMMLTLKRKTA